jgi:hypothetical protein
MMQEYLKNDEQQAMHVSKWYAFIGFVSLIILGILIATPYL